MSFDGGGLVAETFDYDGGRQVTVHVPSVEVESVVFAADGAWHVAGLAEALEGAGARSTMIVGVHGLPDDEGRLHEYVPGFDPQRFAAHEQFFVGEVRRWIATRFEVDLPAGRTAVWGASLGGELALALGLRHPEVYGAVLAASPGAGFQPPPDLPRRRPRCYLVAGTDEPFFLANATRWADALGAADPTAVAADRDVVLAVRSGGHGDAFWHQEFPLMVAWAFGP